MKIVFFKRPKHKQFTYRPRYWNPEAEEFEKRKRQLDGDGTEERTGKEMKEDLRQQMDKQWRRKHAADNGIGSNMWMKIFIYALIIFFGIYFIFFTGFINNLVRFFTE
ncbi:MAG: hypothetical protein ABFS05_04300 [Bacteroidota bacterium]